MMLQNRRSTGATQAKRKRTPLQTKEVQHVIMVCILAEIEKNKEERMISSDNGSERKVSYDIV